MSTNQMSNVNDMVTYTNSFFNSVHKTSHRSITVLIELGIITAIISFATMHNTAAMGILFIAGIGILMNVFTIDSYNKDYAEFQRLCSSFADKYATTRSGEIISEEVVSSINDIREASEGYMTKYKVVSIVNTVTIMVVAILVCLIITAVI